MAIQLDDKKKKTLMVILVCFGVAVLFLFLAYMMTLDGRKETADGAGTEQTNALSNVPDAETDDSDKSKMKIYREQGNGKSISNYWDDLAETDSSVADDLYADSEASGKGASKSGRSADVDVKEYTVDDLFDDNDKNTSSASSSSSSHEQSEAERRYEERMRRNEEAAARAARERKEMRERLLASQSGTGQAEAEVPSPEEKPAEEPKEEEEVERIEVQQVHVRRTGSVSTLDDGYISAGSTGLSSLDAADDLYSAEEQYPFKCMFVRDEKIKSGSRVPIRLLEDMVIDGQLVPKNTHLQATCTLGSRLELNVSTLEIRGRIINFDYDAYDNDGGKGLYYPESNSNTVDRAKDAASNIAFSHASSKVGRVAQDALQVGRILVSQSGNDVTVSVPAGYQFFLVKKVQK